MSSFPLNGSMPTATQKKLLEAEADYLAGILSVNAIARKYGLPESTLRREAKRLGWIRETPVSRRTAVTLALAGASMTNEMANEQVAKIQAAAAVQDIEDMNRGLSVARRVLEKLFLVVDQLEDPRDLKVAVEANRAAIETIRKIRSLDAPPPPPIAQAVCMTVTDGFEELRAAFARSIKAHGGDFAKRPST